MLKALTIYIIFQSFLFSIVLISRKKPENRYLIFYFVYLLLFHVLFTATDVLPETFPGYKYIRSSYQFIAICNSAIVFSFLYSILEKPMPRFLYLLWLLPFFHTLADYLFKKLNPIFYNEGFYNNWYLNFPFYIKILFSVLLIWQVPVFNKEIKEDSSKSHYRRIKLYWGKYFVLLNLILSISLLVYLFFTLTNGRLYHIDSSLLIYSPDHYNFIHRGFITLFLLIFGYLALRDPSTFNLSPTNDQPEHQSHFEQQLAEIVLPEEEKKFQAIVEFPDEETEAYNRILNKLMEDDKIYLDPDLTLNRLSELSAIPSRRLSKFISFTTHKNFKEYINGYRTSHAKNLLIQKNVSNYTMYSIAFDSGFNSESSFYKIFKQQTNLTPKQYQEKFKE